MILLDDRAGSKDLYPHLPKRKAKLLRLDFADVAFSGRGPRGPVTIGIEIKKVPDAVDCIHTGRFAAHQLPGMLESYDYVYLLIEGRIRLGQYGSLSYYHQTHKKWTTPRGGSALRPTTLHDFRCWLSTMATHGGCRIVTSYSTKDSANVVLSLYKWWSKSWGDHKSLKVFEDEREVGGLVKPSTRMRVAAQLPGIGWEKAGRVAAAFPTVMDMVIADPEDWMAIDGIGKTIAHKAVKALRERS